jgi:DME family drug/metabolite transporter
LIVLAAIMWGTTGVATRTVFAIADTTPLSVAFCRLTFSLPALGLASASLLGRGQLRVKRSHLLVMVLIGVMLALYQAFFFAALQHVGVAVATLVTLCAAPVLVAVLSAILLRERPGRPVILALAGAVAGTFLLASPNDAVGPGSDTVAGVLLALASALGYALVALLTRSIARDYHPLLIVTVGFTVGTLVLLPAMLVDGPRLELPPLGWAVLIYLGLIPTALAYALFTRGMRTTSATVASIATLVEPLTATILAWLLLDERIGPLGLVGATLLLGAMISLLRSPQPAST